MRRSALGLGLGMGLVVAGCAAPPPARPPVLVAACPHVPPPKAEPAPRPPVSGFPQLLQPGAWAWAGHAYAWQAPHWTTWLGRSRPLWQAGYWTQAGGGCAWHAAHFLFRQQGPGNAGFGGD